MLGDRGVVRVVDWGLAKVLTQTDVPEELSSEGRAVTRMGSITGTPNYMPPEQALGAIGEIDAQSDVYALGGVLYTILCGEVPYDTGEEYSSHKILSKVQQ